MLQLLLLLLEIDSTTNVDGAVAAAADDGVFNTIFERKTPAVVSEFGGKEEMRAILA